MKLENVWQVKDLQMHFLDVRQIKELRENSRENKKKVWVFFLGCLFLGRLGGLGEQTEARLSRTMIA